MMNKKSKMNYIFSILSLIAVAYFSYQIHDLGMLPIKFEIAVIGILVALMALFNVLVYRFKNIFVSILVKVVLISLSACMAFGGYFIQEGFAALQKMTRPEAKVNEMSLITLEDSK